MTVADMPVPRTWVMEEIPPYDTLTKEVYDTVMWLLQPPTCKVFQTTGQSIPNATFTAVQFQAEALDPYNWHSSTTNNTRITPTFPGWYRGWLGWQTTGATGGNFRICDARQNGSFEKSRRDQKPNIAAQATAERGIPFFFSFNGTTDYVEMMVYQDSGSSMTLPVTALTQAEMFLRWWGPL